MTKAQLHASVRGRPRPIILAFVMVAAALGQGASYWPGIMTWDAINQYGQALEGVFDDWHPPVMAWLWRQLIALKAGPAPMYLVQLALYWIGYGLAVAGALRWGRRWAAILLVACALMPFPLALMGSVLKDCLLEGLLLAAAGLFIWSGPEPGRAARTGAIFVLLLAGLLRFNAFLATLPLTVALLPADWRRTPLRLAGVSVVGLAVMLLAMPAANRLIGADRSDVELSLVIFDLGGITRHTGIDMFPPIGVPDPVAVNARCYRPEKWDSYSPWADPTCPINFDRIDAAVTERGLSPYRMLAAAALAHPIAYAEHRLTHFNINSRFLVHDEVQGPVPDRATDNDWHFTVARNPGLRIINQLTGWSIHSPLGWPIWWIALAAGLLMLRRYLPTRAVIVPLALSALLYGLGYLPFSVSSELRYHLWTITGTAIAAAFAVADIVGGAIVPRRSLALAMAPAIVVGLLCTVWRLT